MKWMLPLSLAILAAACGPSDADHVGAVPKTPTAEAARPGTDAGMDALAQTPPDAEQNVALIGCLAGSPGPAPAGTTGSFKLVDATPDREAGVGANGAGATGGPLVSGKATYDLDGVPNGALGDVNKIVRMTGTIDARPAAPEAPSNRRVEVLSVEVVGGDCGR